MDRRRQREIDLNKRMLVAREGFYEAIAASIGHLVDNLGHEARSRTGQGRLPVNNPDPCPTTNSTGATSDRAWVSRLFALESAAQKAVKLVPSVRSTGSNRHSKPLKVVGPAGLEPATRPL